MLKLLKMEIGMQMTGQRSDASTVDRDGDGLWGGGGPREASSVRLQQSANRRYNLEWRHFTLIWSLTRNI